MAVFLSPYFALKSITLKDDAVHFATILQNEDIAIGENLNLLLLSKGNILSGHLIEIEDNLKKNVSFKEISIMRSGMNDLQISFITRKPAMCFGYQDYIVYFDYDGTIIDTSYLKDENAIFIKGVSIDYFYQGLNILTCNYMLDDISLLCQEIEKYDVSNYTSIRTLINNIEIKDTGSIVIRYDNRLEILIKMTNDVKYITNVMCSILSSMSQNAKGYIDFTISNTPYFTPAS
ncbi:MAG: hypothetical protein WC332_08310 [Clostridia bacterium]